MPTLYQCDIQLAELRSRLEDHGNCRCDICEATRDEIERVEKVVAALVEANHRHDLHYIIQQEVIV